MVRQTVLHGSYQIVVDQRRLRNFARTTKRSVGQTILGLMKTHSVYPTNILVAEDSADILELVEELPGLGGEPEDVRVSRQLE